MSWSRFIDIEDAIELWRYGELDILSKSEKCTLQNLHGGRAILRLKLEVRQLPCDWINRGSVIVSLRLKVGHLHYLHCGWIT